MSEQLTFLDTLNAISLPGSRVGREPFASPAGPMIALAAPEAARALPSRKPEKRKRALNAVAAVLSRALEGLDTSSVLIASTHGSLMGATFGRNSIDSFATVEAWSGHLQQSLESRLVERMARFGSLEYGLRWKELDMVLGHPICALRASARRTSGKGFTGWVSPTAQDHSRGDKPPRPHDTGVPLSQQATLSPWPTPSSRDWKDSPGMATTGTNPDGSERTRLDQLARVASLAGWPRVSCEDHKSDGQKTMDRIETAIRNDTPIPTSCQRLRNLVLALSPEMARGTTTPSSHAGTEKPAESRGALNPMFSLWLHSYPVSWLLAGAMAMHRLSLKPRKASRSRKASSTVSDSCEVPGTPSTPISPLSSSEP